MEGGFRSHSKWQRTMVAPLTYSKNPQHKDLKMSYIPKSSFYSPKTLHDLNSSMLVDMESHYRAARMVHLHWTTTAMTIKCTSRNLNMKILTLYHLSCSSFIVDMLCRELNYQTVENPQHTEEEGDQEHVLTLQKCRTKLPLEGKIHQLLRDTRMVQ